MLEATVVNVALPTIGHDMGASTAGLQWVVDGYLLVLACGLLSAGAAGDRLGRRRVLRIGYADWHGLGVTIEAPANGMRKGVAPDGTEWEQKFSHPYGYVKGIKGADGQEPQPQLLAEGETVHVVCDEKFKRQPLPEQYATALRSLMQ